MTTLSEKEAEEAVNTILPDIRKAIDRDPKGKASVYMRDIANISPAVKREGVNSDVYCKIAGAMFKQGIGTDLGVGIKGDAVLSFRNVRKGEEAPTPTLCKFQWEHESELP